MLGMNELPNVRKHRNLEEYNSTSYMGAAFEQSWTEAPLDSIWRDRELRLANIGQREVKYTYTNPLMGRDIQITETQPKKRLSEDEAKSQIKEAGVPLSVPETSYTQEALDIIIERKKAELLRKDQMDRAKGIVPAVGQFTAMLAAQIVDPINVAASFVPVVAPARYAAMMSKATTAGARALTRAKVGAIEGVAGAAIVEPFVYRATQREQADYTMYDSMLNIGLGSVMGAGLHSGFGAVGDLIKRGVRPDVATATAKPKGNTAKVIAEANPETREAMLKSSIAQELEGKPTNVEAVGSFDNKINLKAKAMPKASKNSDDLTAFIYGERDSIVNDDGTVDKSLISKGLDDIEENASDELYDVFQGDNWVEVNNIVLSKADREKVLDSLLGMEKYHGSKFDDLDSLRLKSKEDSLFVTTDKESARSYAGASGKVYTARVYPERPFFVRNTDLTMDMEGSGIITEIRELGYDSIIPLDLGDIVIIDESALSKPLPKTTDTNQSLENTIRNDVKRGSDVEASRHADEVVAKPEMNIDEELDFANESIANLEQITGVKSANMKEFDDAILKAEEDAKALEAAVMCRLTK